MTKVKDILNKIIEFLKKLFSSIKKKTLEIINCLRKKQILKKIKTFFIKIFGYIGSCGSYLISKVGKTKSEEEIKELYKKEENVLILKKYEKNITDEKLKKKISKKIEDIEVKKKEEKEIFIEDKEFNKKELKREKFNKQLEEIDKKKEQIKASYQDEISISILNMYKKQTNKLINKLEKIENKQSREDDKKVRNKIEEIEKLASNINEQINSLKMLDVPKSKIKKIKKAPAETRVDYLKEKSLVALTSTKKSLVKVGNGVKKVSKKITNKVGTTTDKIKKKIDKKKKIKEQNKILIDNVKYLNKKINVFYIRISNIKNSNTRLQELQLLKEKILDLRDNYDKLTRMKGFKELSFSSS